MQEAEVLALNNLANLDGEEHEYEFQPYKSVLFQHKFKPSNLDKRPQTVQHHSKRQNSLGVESQSNKREQLKNELRILQELNQQELPDNYKQRKKFITTQSVFCMAPTAFASCYNGFPSQPIKKQPAEKRITKMLVRTKENEVPSYFLKTEDMIRMDIKKKFEMRETTRQNSKLTKINNFLKMATNSKRLINMPGLMQKFDEKKLKQTLTNILS